MLNIEINRSAEGVERYFDRELAVSDYLMKEPGIWAGRGAERLGLRGPIHELPVDPREVAVEAYFAKHSVARDRVLTAEISNTEHLHRVR
jgi:hypothetical protein